MDKLPLLTRSQKRKTMTPAALAANRANAQKVGRPKGALSLRDVAFRDRCRVRDEEHIAILEDIAENDPNPGQAEGRDIVPEIGPPPMQSRRTGNYELKMPRFELGP
jgi:hypothetical protein